MPLLKDHYTSLLFPLPRKRPEAVFGAYLQEFGFSGKLSLREIMVLFANALRDYLEGKLDEHTFGSFWLGLHAAPGVEQTLQDEQPNLVGPLIDSVDVSWLSESTYSESFKHNLTTVLEALQALYEEQFE